MAERQEMTVGEALDAIRDARDAMKRGDELLKRVGDLGVKSPKALALMAEPTMRLRERLKAELTDLEKAYENAATGMKS